MCCKGSYTNLRMTAGGKTNNAHNSVMWQAATNRQLAEIFVDCDADSLLRIGECEYCIIAGIALQLANPNNVVTSDAKLLGRLTPNAAIQ